MDQRVRYTKMTIRKTFFEKLKEKPIDRITVSELCKCADINRTTFYKYYENAYDLLDKLEGEIMDELSSRIEEAGATNFIDTLRITLTTIREDEATYHLLFESCEDSEFRARLFHLCYEENMRTIDRIFHSYTSTQKDWIYHFIAEGCNGILQQWFQSGMEASVEEVVSFICGLVKGINQTALPLQKNPPQ